MAVIYPFLLLLAVTSVMSEFQLTILHTNDVHARIEQADKAWRETNVTWDSPVPRRQVHVVRTPLHSGPLMNSGFVYEGTQHCGEEERRPNPVSWTTQTPGCSHLLVVRDLCSLGDITGIWADFANSAPCTAALASTGKCFGGSARIRTVVKQTRQKYSNTLLLDAGDQFQGTVWFYQFGGLVTARFMNLIQYDAMAIGNHEFDNRLEGLVPFASNVTFPLLSSNMNLDKTPSLAGLIVPSTVLTVGGQKVGVVGYTTTETSSISRPETVTFIDELKAIQAEVDKLTSQGVNKIIALGHSGFAMDLDIAKRLNNVDIVVGGHTNTFLYNGTAPSTEVPEGVYPTVVESQDKSQRVLVIQDYAYGKYLGELHVVFDDQGKVTSWTGNPVLLDNSIVQDPETLSIINTYLPQIEQLKNTTIGFTNVDLMADRVQCRTTECNLGNVLADAFLAANIFLPKDNAWNDVSMAIVNAGSFRSSIPTGSITLENAVFVQPFRNTIDMIRIKGQTIYDMFELMAGKWTTDIGELFGGFLQVSGIQLTLDINRPVGSRVVEVKVTCSKCHVPKLEPLKLEEEYNVLVGSFIYQGGDGYTMFPSSIIKKTIIGKIDTDVFVDYIKSHSPITTGLQGRIRHIQDIDNIDNTDQCSQSEAVVWQPSLLVAFICFVSFMSNKN